MKNNPSQNMDDVNKGAYFSMNQQETDNKIATTIDYSFDAQSSTEQQNEKQMNSLNEQQVNRDSKENTIQNGRSQIYLTISQKA